ncbi:MAG: hypothetical protein MZV65_27765 [Chromatiales bacterium]|nr:hypothetical protein [Chromatiales bacterium]
MVAAQADDPSSHDSSSGSPRSTRRPAWMNWSGSSTTRVSVAAMAAWARMPRRDRIGGQQRRARRVAGRDRP